MSFGKTFRLALITLPKAFHFGYQIRSKGKENVGEEIQENTIAIKLGNLL